MRIISTSDYFRLRKCEAQKAAMFIKSEAANGKATLPLSKPSDLLAKWQNLLENASYGESWLETNESTINHNRTITKERRLSCSTGWSPEGSRWTKSIPRLLVEDELCVPGSGKHTRLIRKLIRLIQVIDSLLWGLFLLRTTFASENVRHRKLNTNKICIGSEFPIP